MAGHGVSHDDKVLEDTDGIQKFLKDAKEQVPAERFNAVRSKHYEPCLDSRTSLFFWLPCQSQTYAVSFERN